MLVSLCDFRKRKNRLINNNADFVNIRSLKNLASVAFLQGTNFLLPAIVLPFLIRYLGPADYGLYNLAQIWAVYFAVIIGYGFDLSGTKEFAIARNDSGEWSVIYSRIFYSKLFLLAVSTVSLVVIILVIDNMRANALIYLMMFIWILNNFFFPSSFYLGIEKQSVVSVYSLLSRDSSFLLILALIYFKAPLILLVLAFSVPQALTALIFHLYTVRKFRIVLKPVTVAAILKYLRDSFVLFLSTVAGTITVSISVILLGMLASRESVGYFSVSTKLVSLFYGIVLFPFQVVFFPIIIKKVNASYAEGARHFLKLLALSFGLMAIFCSVIYFGAEDIVRIFVGDAFEPAIAPLKIVCFVPFFTLIDMLIGLFLVAIDRRLAYTGIVTIGMAVCVTLNLCLIPTQGEKGASWAWLIAEMCCFVCFIFVFIKNHVSRVSTSEPVSIKVNS